MPGQVTRHFLNTKYQMSFRRKIAGNINVFTSIWHLLVCGSANLSPANQQILPTFATQTMKVFAKKSYGQHFLKNDSIAERIADSLQLGSQTGQVLEIGPGQGMLTKFLLEKKGFQTWAVEADPDMVEILKNNFPAFSERLVFKDFLNFDPAEIFGDRPFCLIGNFPYNISTEILFKLIELRDQIPEMVGMFQKEVADRVVSRPGSKVYGITSVISQAFFKTEYLFSVAPGSFSPPPKVQSAVIRLTRKMDENGQPTALGCDEKTFRRMVKMAFNQRRKMLRNTLKDFFPPEILMNDPFFEKRPEVLGWEDYVKLVKQFSSNPLQKVVGEEAKNGN